MAVALDLLERRAGATRQQIDGDRRRLPTGIAAATFVHRTNREGDPGPVGDDGCRADPAWVVRRPEHGVEEVGGRGGPGHGEADDQGEEADPVSQLAIGFASSVPRAMSVG